MAKRSRLPRAAGGGLGAGKAVAKKPAGPPIVLGIVIGAVVLVVIGVIILQVQAMNKPVVTSSRVTEGTGWGPVDAPVKIVEYSDFGCTYCRQFALSQGKQLQQEYAQSGKVRFDYRSFIIEGPSTRDAANAAYCAADQGRFWDYTDILFARAGVDQPQVVFAKAALKDYGTVLGVDTAIFNRCVDSGTHLPDVTRENADGVRLGVQATPTFFINGKKIEGAVSYSSFRAAIEAALAAAGS